MKAKVEMIESEMAAVVTVVECGGSNGKNGRRRDASIFAASSLFLIFCILWYCP